MKQILISLATLLTAFHLAQAQSRVLSIAQMGTNNSACITNDLNVRGKVLEILFDVTTPTTMTGSVAVVALPELPGMSARILATNGAITADAIYRPRFFPTDIDGNSLTNYDGEPFYAVGENLQFIARNGTGSSGTVYRCILKYQKD